MSPRHPMFNSSDYPELQPELVRYLEFCFALPAFDPEVARIYEQVARLFADPDLEENLYDNGR
jgi:hypothetical protein